MALVRRMHSSLGSDIANANNLSVAARRCRLNGLTGATTAFCSCPGVWYNSSVLAEISHFATYSAHLALDQRINIKDSRLHSTHETEQIPICLEGASTIKTLAPVPQHPVEKAVEDVNWKQLERLNRVSPSKFSVPERSLSFRLRMMVDGNSY